MMVQRTNLNGLHVKSLLHASTSMACLCLVIDIIFYLSSWSRHLNILRICVHTERRSRRRTPREVKQAIRKKEGRRGKERQRKIFSTELQLFVVICIKKKFLNRERSIVSRVPNAVLTYSTCGTLIPWVELQWICITTATAHTFTEVYHYKSPVVCSSYGVWYQLANYLVWQFN